MAKNFRTNVVEGGLTIDPSAPPGFPAAVGSILPRRGTAQLWQKTGAADTAWALLSGGGSSVITWGNDDVAAAADTRFLAAGRQQGTASLTDNKQMPMPRAGTLRNLFVRHNAAVGNANTVVYTVQVNGVDTAITVTLAANAVAQASDLANTAVIVQGDRIGLKAVKGASIANGNIMVQATVELGS